MQHYPNFDTLLSDYKNLHYPGGIFLQSVYRDELLVTRFWVLSSKEVNNQEWGEPDFGSVPVSLVLFKVRSFLDTGTFQDIIDNNIEHDPALKLTDTGVFLKALQHYLEYDDF